MRRRGEPQPTGAASSARRTRRGSWDRTRCAHAAVLYSGLEPPAVPCRTLRSLVRSGAGMGHICAGTGHICDDARNKPFHVRCGPQRKRATAPSHHSVRVGRPRWYERAWILESRKYWLWSGSWRVGSTGYGNYTTSLSGCAYSATASGAAPLVRPLARGRSGTPPARSITTLLTRPINCG